MTWQVDLLGEDADIGELAKVAPVCECAIALGADDRQCLTGPRFTRFSNSEEVRAEASQLMDLLNGLARIRHGNHRPVRLGASVSHLGPDGRRDVTVRLTPVEIRSRVSLEMTVTRSDGSIETAPPSDRSMERAKRIASDPKLVEIAEALGGDITWQRLRVAFEKLTVLVGKSRKDDNALVKHGYATQDELNAFKANIEDPRHSGLDAVHGVPQGPLKGTKMNEQRGLAFVVRLFENYVDRS